MRNIHRKTNREQYLKKYTKRITWMEIENKIDKERNIKTELYRKTHVGIYIELHTKKDISRDVHGKIYKEGYS